MVDLNIQFNRDFATDELRQFASWGHTVGTGSRDVKNELRGNSELLDRVHSNYKTK